MPLETAEDLAIFFDPEEFGDAAVYRPVDGGALLPLHVVHNEPGDGVNYGTAQVVDVHTVLIRRVDVDLPAQGDILSLAKGVDLSVIGLPRLDRAGMVWTCGAEVTS